MYKLLNIAIIVSFIILSQGPATYAHDQIESKEKIRLEFGTVVQFKSKILDESRQLFIVLPDDYDSSSTEYPVLYALDGSPFTMAWIYPSLFNRGTPPLIVVGIGNVDRLRDLTLNAVGEPRPTAGNARTFLKVLSKEIIPFIDSNYRTSKYRAIYGASSAGLFSAWAFFEKPDLFNGCISSSPVVGNAMKRLKKTIDASNKKRQRNYRKLVIVYNEYDLANVNGFISEFVDIMNKGSERALDVVSVLNHDLGHFASVSVPVGMRNLFDDFLIPEEEVVDKGMDFLDEYFKMLSDKYGLTSPAQYLMQSNRFRESANGFVTSGELDKGIVFLDHAREKFQEASVLLYFQGLFYELDGKLAKAKKLFREAKELNNDDAITYLAKLRLMLLER